MRIFNVNGIALYYTDVWLLNKFIYAIYGNNIFFHLLGCLFLLYVIREKFPIRIRLRYENVLPTEHNRILYRSKEAKLFEVIFKQNEWWLLNINLMIFLNRFLKV